MNITVIFLVLTVHNWQKFKKYIYIPGIKKYNFVDMWNEGQFLDKIDILAITAQIKFESEIYFAHNILLIEL